MIPTRSFTILVCALAIVCVLTQTVQAGCPFDDGSCQEYCGQQGCNLGYCGHFAWIQCICRKCGDEWNWYDKVHYNPDKQVNQTELDSLKLNGSAPLILTNNNAKLSPVREAPTVPTTQQVSTAGQRNQPKAMNGLPHLTTVATPAKQQEQPKVAATLTTLLIPDLSDGTKLDLNDIPDENSEKFLDYLTKNHEKLVQATNSAQQKGSPSKTSQEGDNESKDDDDETDNEDLDADSQTTRFTGSSPDGETQPEEAIEIQISSSNNNQPTAQQTATTTAPSSKSGKVATASGELDQQQSAAGSGLTMRLLRMAVAGKSPDDIF